MQSGKHAHTIWIAAFIFCMAAPVRFWVSLGPFSSISIMDVAVVMGGLWLTLLAIRGEGFLYGNARIFTILCMPLLASTLSLLWSQDIAASTRWTIVNVESLVAYLLVIRLYHCVQPNTIVNAMASFIIVCLSGAILSLARVPGFEPHTPPDVPTGSAYYVDYLISYYARLSHPFIGLSNDFAAAFSGYVLPLFAWGIVQGRRRYSIIATLTVLAITFTLSRGVIISIIATGTCFCLGPRLRWTLPWLGAVLGLMAVGVSVYYLVVPEVASTIVLRASESDIEDRVVKLHIGADKVMNRPTFGYGSGAAADGSEVLIGGSHNIVMDMMLYFGIVPGLIVCLGLAVIPLTFFECIAADASVKLMAGAIGFALVCQFLIFLSETAFDASILRVYFYVFIGTGGALIRAMEVRRDRSITNVA